jgi:predicted DNA-binding transcriptional regulator AlpA
MTENRILLVGEVASMLRLSVSRINNLLTERKQGKNTFPLPLSVAGGKRRWARESIEAYIASQLEATSPVPPTARQKRRSAKAHQERQAATDRALERYRTRKGDA